MIPLFSLRMNFAAMAVALLYLTTVEPWRVNSEEQTLMVNITLVTNARETSA
ncbi:notum-like protein, partial [Trifolium medium]|nr:notum-like protein [Trifolium medium]